jgi:hypothetical protein
MSATEPGPEDILEVNAGLRVHLAASDLVAAADFDDDEVRDLIASVLGPEAEFVGEALVLHISASSGPLADALDDVAARLERLVAACGCRE